MKNQKGYTPLTWILIVSISLLIIGVIIAMLFVNTDIVYEIKEKIQNSDEQKTIETNINTDTYTNYNNEINDENKTNIE